MNQLSWEPLCKANFYVFLYQSSIGTQVKLVNCKGALNPQVVYTTDHPKVVVPVLVLLCVALWLILWGGFQSF